MKQKEIIEELKKGALITAHVVGDRWRVYLNCNIQARFPDRMRQYPLTYRQVQALCQKKIIRERPDLNKKNTNFYDYAGEVMCMTVREHIRERVFWCEQFAKYYEDQAAAAELREDIVWGEYYAGQFAGYCDAAGVFSGMLASTAMDAGLRAKLAQMIGWCREKRKAYFRRGDENKDFRMPDFWYGRADAMDDVRREVVRVVAELEGEKCDPK